jgi:uncharacterized protein involved in exopolysaccharide biosynthesis
MVTPLKLLTNNAVVPQARREEIAPEKLWAVYRGKWRMMLVFVAALLVAILVIAFIKPRHPTEASIQFDFGPESDELFASTDMLGGDHVV